MTASKQFSFESFRDRVRVEKKVRVDFHTWGRISQFMGKDRPYKDFNKFANDAVNEKLKRMERQGR